MQRAIKINNKTKRNINIEQWKKWIKTYCNHPPLSIYVIYPPKGKEKKKLKGGFLFEEIYVYVRKGETEESINHTFLHELAHWIVSHKEDLWKFVEIADNEIEEFMTNNRVSKKQIHSDHFQDTLSYEEVFADMFALMVLGLK